MNPQPKESAWRSEQYRRLVAANPCEHCRYAGGQQAAHADYGKGGQWKSDDRTCFALCATQPGRDGCHHIFGASGMLPRDVRRMLEVRYACRTIGRFLRLGVWSRLGVDLPDWYVNEEAAA